MDTISPQIGPGALGTQTLRLLAGEPFPLPRPDLLLLLATKLELHRVDGMVFPVSGHLKEAVI